MAEFLSFCQDVSEANGNARPLLVAHNSMFDNSMLLRNCWQAGIQVPGSWRSLCTLKVAKGLAQDSPRFTIENNQLSTVAKYFGYAARFPQFRMHMHLCISASLFASVQ